ncbi:hypothetical protein [Nocardia bovistercoris]|uniref:Uncharacterized protein n=1 Tax=Nocardia bovistercoris TaxID=2785916 RepID=A0A931IFE6_9NOCA|nr:hypothetical protein [Nocardia bovistercoris]MBH0780519.1 hypothetical protein [Nocardia bovistercoris]
MDSEQLGLDFHVEQTPWGKWVNPERRATQTCKFMKYAGLQQIPAQPWPEDSPEVARIDPLVAALFPDMATAMAPESADKADAFICFMGECFIKYVGAEWIDWQSFAPGYSFYQDVNPAVLCDTDDEDEIGMWHLVKDMIEDHSDDGGMFSYFASTVREYATYHNEKRQADANVK